MTLAFRAEALSLGGLLSGDRHFAVPVFQRAYSWTSREVAQLSGDLWLGLEQSREDAGQDHGLLLGSLVVVKEPGPSGGVGAAESVCWVIDGKQRLTTLTVLLAALRDKLGLRANWISDLIWRNGASNGLAPSVPRLTLDLEEDAYFGVQVRRPGSSADPLEPDGEHRGRLRLRECQQTIVDDLEDRPDSDLIALAEYLRDRVALVLISAPDIDTGFRTFVTTNHRGKPLTATDILKTELMAEVPEKDRHARLDQWAAAERTLGTDFQELPGYLRAVYGKAHGATIRDVLALSHREGGAAQFLDTHLFPLASRLHPILNASHAGSPLSGRINAALRHLTWLKARDWVPPALAFSSRYPGRDLEFALFLEGLERLAYGHQVLGNGADKRLTRYRNVMEALGTAVPANGHVPQLDLTEDEQWTMQLNARSNLYHRSPAACKVLLKRLSASYPGDDPVTTLSDVTVEHVLPRNVPAESPWRQHIPNAEDREACSKMLGNLVLISKPQNKEARNHPFDVKRLIYFPGGQASPHAITDQLRPLNHWRAEDIRARDADLQARMVTIWRLTAGPRAKRAKPGATS
jgi:Protein of unknown function DUF262/Protein of unknown function (DUF1524)